MWNIDLYMTSQTFLKYWPVIVSWNIDLLKMGLALRAYWPHIGFFPAVIASISGKGYLIAFIRCLFLCHVVVKRRFCIYWTSPFKSWWLSKLLVIPCFLLLNVAACWLGRTEKIDDTATVVMLHNLSALGRWIIIISLNHHHFWNFYWFVSYVFDKLAPPPPIINVQKIL